MPNQYVILNGQVLQNSGSPSVVMSATGPTTGQVITSPDGVTAAWGTNAASSKDYSLFYALMPSDNSATIAVGAPVLFPQAGPTTGVITAASTSTFTLPAIGNYEVIFQCSVTEAGQLQVALNGTGVAYTVVGRAAGTTQIMCHTVITTVGVNALLSVINPVGNSTALTMTLIAGGASAVSATLLIKAL